jgi:tetratricopeptide (TPR) repeat protein
VLSIDPGLAEARERLVFLLLELGRPEEARALSAQLTSITLYPFKQWARLADELAARGQTDGAAQAWSAALSLADRASVRRALAILLLEAGRADEARSHLAVLAQAGHEGPKSWLRLAQALHAKGDNPGATAVLDLVLSLQDNAGAHEMLGGMAFAAGDLAKAAHHLRIATSAAPANTKNWERLALSLEQLGDLAGAVETRRGLERQIGPHAANNERTVELLLELNRPLEALEAVAGSPELAGALEQLVGAQAAPDGAIAALEASRDNWRGRWPQGGWAFNGLLIAMAREGRRDEAIQLYLGSGRRAPAYTLSQALADFRDPAGPASGKAPGGPPPPLALISQIQRSGGTLLAQLFDGHPQTLTYPGELKIGFPQKWNWPELDLSQGPEAWFQTLFDVSIERFLTSGYLKADGNQHASADPRPFRFDVGAFHDRFMLDAAAAKTNRQVLEAYLGSYFSSWEDGSPSGRPRWTIAFCPRLIMFEQSVTGFFRDYPDGRIISCVRDPVDWYASSRRHSPEYETVERALPLWTGSVRAGLELARARPGQVELVGYEELVRDVDGQMRRLAERLDIRFDPILTTPTFAGEPVLPNSSFAIAETGVHRRSLDQRALLGGEELAAIEAAAAPLFQEALAFMRDGT